MRTLGTLVLAVAALAVSTAEAQQRPAMGNPIAQMRGQGGGPPGVAPMGMEGFGMGLRALRDARDPGAFVGAGAPADPSTFIGGRGGQTAEAIQAAEAAAAQAAAARPAINNNDAAAAAINRGAQPARRLNLYTPRLSMDMLAQEVEPAQVTARAEAASQEVAEILTRRFNSAIEVSLEERTATLRGEVVSASERDLAERLVRFEPGISRVQNELVIQGAGSP